MLVFAILDLDRPRRGTHPGEPRQPHQPAVGHPGCGQWGRHRALRIARRHPSSPSTTSSGTLPRHPIPRLLRLRTHPAGLVRTRHRHRRPGLPGVALRAVPAHPLAADRCVAPGHGPRHFDLIGVSLVVLGALSMVGATVQHGRFIATLPEIDRPAQYSRGWALWLCSLVALASLALAAYLAYVCRPECQRHAGDARSDRRSRGLRLNHEPAVPERDRSPAHLLLLRAGQLLPRTRSPAGSGLPLAGLSRGLGLPTAPTTVGSPQRYLRLL